MTDTQHVFAVSDWQLDSSRTCPYESCAFFEWHGKGSTTCPNEDAFFSLGLKEPEAYADDTMPVMRVSQSICQSSRHPASHTFSQSVNQSINQSINQPDIQPATHSVSQSINQSINQPDIQPPRPIHPHPFSQSVCQFVSLSVIQSVNWTTIRFRCVKPFWTCSERASPPKYQVMLHYELVWQSVRLNE